MLEFRDLRELVRESCTGVLDRQKQTHTYTYNFSTALLTQSVKSFAPKRCPSSSKRSAPTSWD
jgi:hypothetical protein